MNPRSRRRARTLAVLLVGAVAAAVLTSLTPVHPPTATAADTDAPVLTVGALSPDVAQPGGTLRLSGTVKAGAEQLDDGIVRLRVGSSPIALRAQLSDLAEGRTQPFTNAAATEPESTDQRAGSTRTWSLSVELDPLRLGAAGAYPVVVNLDSAVTGLTFTSVTTFLSWFPEGTTGQPTKVVWAVPLVGTPARDADGVFLDDRTAAAISPGGRLRALLDGAGGTAVSWVVDPELLEAVRDMSDGYEVLGEDGEIEPGGAAGAAAARTFLTDVRAQLATVDVSSLGYADPDVNALVGGGLSSDVDLAMSTGVGIASAVLGRRGIRADLAWPPGDAADRPTLIALRSAGAESVILADTTMPVDEALTYTPTGLVDLPSAAGGLTGVLTDSTLDEVIGEPAAQGGYALARARYLAETLVVTQQRPSEPRTIVVAPPRDWDVDRAFARNVVTFGGRVPWLSNASMGDLLAATPPDVGRGPVSYPEVERKAELSNAQVDGMRELGTGIATFTGVLADPTATRTRLTAAQLRTGSAAFRAQRASGTALLNAITTDLDRDRARVRVLSRGTVRLSGASGQVPITVANDLDQSVIVQVRLVPSSAVKLRVDTPEEVRLGPRKKETIEVGARAATSGTVPVEVVLLTRTGEVYSEPVTLQVRSTAYSRVGLVIVVVAFGALLVLVVARIVRRTRGRTS